MPTVTGFGMTWAGPQEKRSTVAATTVRDSLAADADRRRGRLLGPRLSRQDVVDGDLAALPAVHHDGDLLTGWEVLPGRITGRSRIGVDLDPAVDQVDDPVNGDAGAPIEVSLLAIGTHVRP